MTIMFSDVRGFTTISEIYKDDPQGLTALMNSFLTPLTNAIIDRKGTIDKYMGDAIMAFWNAPLDDPTHELNACEAALDMLERVERLNREREAAAKANGTLFIPINIGVGINTGRCVVGNMGSDLRFDYSVLGDSVNLASRLEGQMQILRACRSSSARETANAAKDKFALLELDFIAVKGKKEPEVVYSIVGRNDLANSGRFQRWRELNMNMLSRYRSRDWAGALGGHRSRASPPTRRTASRPSTTSIPSGSARSRSPRRPMTGTAPTPWIPSRRRGEARHFNQQAIENTYKICSVTFRTSRSGSPP